MTTIYQDGSYQITITNGRATLTNGTQKVVFPVRSQAPEIPANYLDSLKKAGQNPENFFFVGTPGNGTILRRGALPVWEAAVKAEQARLHAEKEAKEAARAAEIASQGRKALMFWGPYATSASLVIVRPATDDEKSGLADWYAAGLYIELDSTSVDVDRANDLFGKWNLKEQGNTKHTRREESCLWFITDAQWEEMLAADRQVKEEKIAAKKAEEQTEANRIEAARQQADQTGEPAEIGRYMDDCDKTQPDCSFDLIRRMIRGDGTIYTTRTHCH